MLGKILKANAFFSIEDYLPKKMASCEDCGLYKNVLSPKMPYSGGGKKKILIIAEAPGEVEDKKGTQLVGPVGIYFKNKLKKYGLSLHEDFWKINSINCQPPGNREPYKNELKCCRPFIEETIKETQPKVIWLLGTSAVESHFMGRFSETMITRWKNLIIPDYSVNAWIISLFHPSFGSRKEEDALTQSVFDRDLKNAVNFSIDPPPLPKQINLKDHIVCLTDFDQICDLLENILKQEPKYLAFDYETTGLKPYKKGHKIVSISLCFDGKTSYSFPFQYRNHFEDSQIKYLSKLWSRILRGSKISKIAHNLGFEEMWSRNIIGVEVNPWAACTMVSSHILDNRKKFTGLKFQAFINWGIEGYETKAKKFLSNSNEKGFNKIMELDLSDLLPYNAIDSLITYWLFEKQKEQFLKNKELKKANEFFKEGILAMIDIQNHGIYADKIYYEKKDKELASEIVTVEAELKGNAEIVKFERLNNKKINYKSTFDLKKLFYDQIGLSSSKTTDKGSKSVDEEVLNLMKHPIAKQIIQKRKLEKIKDTYLGQFLREIDDDSRIHPFINLHIPRTFRSSSSYPNSQNLPVRDEKAKRIARGGLKPSPGNLILDWDYGAMEVRIIACYTKDPILINYINNPKSDMHRDQASLIFGLTNKQMTKDLRYQAKNKLVFPEFYGSYYKACARDLWEARKLLTGEGQKVYDHLFDVGILKNEISAYEEFEAHIKDVEWDFWKRFKATKKWQNNHVEQYIKNGYIQMFHGFKYDSGVPSYNKIINAPIQGTAFHCLLWSIIEINKELKAKGKESKFMMQIHDSGVMDVTLKEKEEVRSLTKEIATKRIRKVFPWIIVPLIIEWEETEINGAWYEKEQSD